MNWASVHIIHRKQKTETILSEPRFLDMIETRMRYWGDLIGVTHAEPFLTNEPFAIPDLMKALG